MAAQLAGQARLLRSGGAQFVHLGGMCVESLPLELKVELSTSASLLGAAPPATHVPFHPAYIPVEPAPPERKTPVRIRLDLQRPAATNLRRHMLRALRGFTVLVAERRVVDRIVARVQPPERDRLDTLFVGSGPECLSAIASPAFTESVEHRPIGFVDSHVPSTPGALGDLRDFSLLLAGSGAQV